MKVPDTLSVPELNSIIRSMPLSPGRPFPVPKEWKRVDVGKIECYVGDRLCVVALVEKQSETIGELKENQVNTEVTIIRYLKGEGWIDKEYIYVGMQKFNLNNPPKGFTDED